MVRDSRLRKETMPLVCLPRHAGTAVIAQNNPGYPLLAALWITGGMQLRGTLPTESLRASLAVISSFAGGAVVSWCAVSGTLVGLREKLTCSLFLLVVRVM